MRELKRECPGIEGNVPAFGVIRNMLGIEASVQAERFERLWDEAGINEAVAAMKGLRRREGMFARFVRRLAGLSRKSLVNL
ncbi:MAG: hypothetical protein IJG37_03645 [Synergistaceae bacterium]|nr:hypothetical protein [Synergistaceae bacterium]MBQ7168716.1 hypothetical protein [Synergistaceae bacterium]